MKYGNGKMKLPYFWLAGALTRADREFIALIAAESPDPDAGRGGLAAESRTRGWKQGKWSGSFSACRILKNVFGRFIARGYSLCRFARS